VLCDGVYSYQIFPVLAHRIWCKVQFYFPNLCMVLKCHRNCICSKHKCQQTVKVAWSKRKWFFFKAVYTRFPEDMFSVYRVISCAQADGESSSGCSAGLQIRVRQGFGILQFRTLQYVSFCMWIAKQNVNECQHQGWVVACVHNVTDAYCSESELNNFSLRSFSTGEGIVELITPYSNFSVRLSQSHCRFSRNVGVTNLYYI
jgi:hypothetical protein